MENPDLGKPTSPPPHNQSMWDTFEHILLFLTLYVVAISGTLLLHTFIDKWLPGFSYDSYSSMTKTSVNSFDKIMTRGYLAALIVSYPLFVFLFFHVVKRTLKDPSLRLLKSRKTLIYFTLVVTFIIMLWKVISIVFGLLNGNVTMNFLAHFAVTTGVNGFIFVYYFNQIKHDRANSNG